MCCIFMQFFKAFLINNFYLIELFIAAKEEILMAMVVEGLVLNL